jgi:hypothetical protein
MELVGDEKRIQALFSELKFQDQSIAPSFDRLWNSVPYPKPKRMAFVHPMVVFATIIIFGAISAVALWSKQAPNVDISVARDVAPVVSVPIEVDVEPRKKLSRKPHHSLVRKNVRSAELEPVMIEKVAVLSSWQSPTNSLMAYPSIVVVTSLPEFAQSVKDLESYLSTDGMEELK